MRDFPAARRTRHAMLAVFFLGCFAPAASSAPDPAQPIQLVVAPLRNTGGLDPGVTGGTTLDVKYTTALIKYLKAAAGTAYVVSSKPLKHSDPATDLTLEGDISHVAARTPDGGPYVCVLRLFREDASHTLLGEWIGEAQSLRSLTGNLRSVSAMDHQGLLGELGARVAAAISDSGADQTRAFATLAAASAVKTLDATPVLDTSPDLPTASESGAPAPLTGEVVSESRFRLRVVSQDAGDAYLIGLDAAGRPLPLFVPTSGQTLPVAAGAPVLLPPKEPLTAASTAEPLNQQFVVLVRRSPAPAPPAPAPAVTPADFETSPRTALISMKTRTVSQEPSPVQVLEVLPPASTGDPDIARLLKAAAADPPGTWMARQITVHVVPLRKAVPKP